LERFWELEEESKEDLESNIWEENFTKTIHIDSLGRYVAKIPFKEEQTLEEYKGQAIARFLNLEKKLIKNQSIKEQDCKFMIEYMSLGHMVEANSL